LQEKVDHAFSQTKRESFCLTFIVETLAVRVPNVELTGAARLYRAASELSDGLAVISTERQHRIPPTLSLSSACELHDI
jgi:hypothetical protein